MNPWAMLKTDVEPVLKVPSTSTPRLPSRGWQWPTERVCRLQNLAVIDCY